MARAHYRNYENLKRLAGNLRRNQTPSEVLLWEVLRNKKLSGFKFLRQHPVIYREDNGWVEFFIADFYCSKLKIIIELDGPIHELQQEYDIERDSKLLNKGITVLRIDNEELNDINSAILKIKEFLKLRTSQITYT